MLAGKLEVGSVFSSTLLSWLSIELSYFRAWRCTLESAFYAKTIVFVDLFWIPNDFDFQFVELFPCQQKMLNHANLQKHYFLSCSAIVCSCFYSEMFECHAIVSGEWRCTPPTRYLNISILRLTRSSSSLCRSLTWLQGGVDRPLIRL